MGTVTVHTVRHRAPTFTVAPNQTDDPSLLFFDFFTHALPSLRALLYVLGRAMGDI